MNVASSSTGVAPLAAVFITVTYTGSPSNFTAAKQAEFIAQVAAALGVSADRIKITGVTATVDTSRRSLVRLTLNRVNKATTGGTLVTFSIEPSTVAGQPSPSVAAANFLTQFNDPASTLRQSPALAGIDASVTPTQTVITQCSNGSYVTPCPTPVTPPTNNKSSSSGGLSGAGLIILIIAIISIAIVVVLIIIKKWYMQPAKSTEFSGVELQYDETGRRNTMQPRSDSVVGNSAGGRTLANVHGPAVVPAPVFEAVQEDAAPAQERYRVTSMIN